jgi:plastocyanin domain-containing protein
MPVKWIIDAKPGDIDGCNNRFLSEALGLDVSLQTGENVIEFTPTQTGTATYACWMSMNAATINIVAPS